jgi:hypothetical protein
MTGHSIGDDVAQLSRRYIRKAYGQQGVCVLHNNSRPASVFRRESSIPLEEGLALTCEWMRVRQRGPIGCRFSAASISPHCLKLALRHGLLCVLHNG